MKWSYVGLLLLGVAAALAAAVLVSSIRRRARRALEEQQREVEAVCAAKKLSAMIVIDASCLTTKKLQKKRLPPDGFSDPAEVLGRVLIVPMVEGQILTKQCLACEGSGHQLASALPDGMRAVTIHLPDECSLGGILYPGNVVDILAFFVLRSENDSGSEAVSAVLAQGVQVLAVEEETVTTAEPSELGKPPARRRGPRMVTLMMDVARAQALQLAMTRGKVMLALRNPKDAATTDTSPACLRRLYEDFVVRESGPGPESPPPPSEWQIVIIRGEERATQRFPAPPLADGAMKK